MNGCVITCSHITKSQKLEMKEKLLLMGGRYTDDFNTSTTHLVTESVQSMKYCVSVLYHIFKSYFLHK